MSRITYINNQCVILYIYILSWKRNGTQYSHRHLRSASYFQKLQYQSLPLLRQELLGAAQPHIFLFLPTEGTIISWQTHLTNQSMMLLLSSKGQISPHINDEILQHLRSCTAYSIFFYIRSLFILMVWTEIISTQLFKSFSRTNQTIQQLMMVVYMQ